MSFGLGIAYFIVMFLVTKYPVSLPTIVILFNRFVGVGTSVGAVTAFGILLFPDGKNKGRYELVCR